MADDTDGDALDVAVAMHTLISSSMVVKAAAGVLADHGDELTDDQRADVLRMLRLQADVVVVAAAGVMRMVIGWAPPVG